MDIPFNISYTVSLDELKQYNSACEFVKASGFMQNDNKYVERVGTLGELYDTALYEDHHGNIQKMMEYWTAYNHAEGWGIQKEVIPCIILTIPKNAPHLREFNKYWLDMQSKYGGVYDPIDRGDRRVFYLFPVFQQASD